MNKDKLIIEQIHNGFTTTYEEEDEDEYVDKVVTAFVDNSPLKECDIEYYGTKNSEKACMSKLLYAVAEHFGANYNKWKEENLSIKWDKKGHKLD